MTATDTDTALEAEPLPSGRIHIGFVGFGQNGQEFVSYISPGQVLRCE